MIKGLLIAVMVSISIVSIAAMSAGPSPDTLALIRGACILALLDAVIIAAAREDF